MFSNKCYAIFKHFYKCKSTLDKMNTNCARRKNGFFFNLDFPLSFPKEPTEREVSHSIKILCSGRMSFLDDAFS